MKQKMILLVTLIMVAFLTIFFTLDKKENNSNEGNNRKENENLISVLVDGVEQSAFPSKGSAEYQSTSCTNGETAVWDATNWKLSIQDISASTRCVVSFVTGGHNVYVTVSGGTVDNAPKQVNHNGNTTFTVASSNSNYVFSSVKCTGVNSYSWANNVLSVNGVQADAYCDVVFSRPTYTVYFNVTGGYTENNYVTVVRGGGNSTTFGAIAGYLTSGSIITCDPGITGKIAGDRIVVSNVLSSGDCSIQCAKDSSNYLPGGGVYNVGDEVSYANLAWQVVSDNGPSVTLILKGNAIYSSTSSSNLTGTGIFGSGVTYTSSSARSYLVDIWLEQDAQKYLRNAINSEGLEYQDDANGYIRLPYAAEVNTNLPNASSTNFWTMDNDGGGRVYYGQPTGYLYEGKATDNKYYFEHYTLANNTSVNYSNLGNCPLPGTYYQGYGSSCAAIQFSNASVPIASSSSVTLNPYSGGQANGSYSNGYKKVTKNVMGSEVKSSTATINTTLTYNALTNSTVGNSGMTNGVQAVLPTASSARTNDSVPTTSSSNVGGTGTLSTSQYYSTQCAQTGTYSSNWGMCTYCSGCGTIIYPYYCSSTGSVYSGSFYVYDCSTSGSHDMRVTYSACGNTYVDYTNNYGTHTTSSHLGCSGKLGTCTTLTITNPSSCSKTYNKYTLNQNTSTMGYRPVIVVYKAN